MPARLQPAHTNPTGTVQQARLAWCHQQPEKPLVKVMERDSMNTCLVLQENKDLMNVTVLFSTVVSSEEGKYNMHQPKLSAVGQNCLFSSFSLFSSDFSFLFPTPGSVEISHAEILQLKHELCAMPASLRTVRML